MHYKSIYVLYYIFRQHVTVRQIKRKHPLQTKKKTQYVCLNGAGEAHSKGKGAQKGTHPLNTQKKGSKGRLINPV